jgi:hypothetical protein
MDLDKNNVHRTSEQQTGEDLLDQAETRIWALLDDRIESADVKRLECLIREHEQVRQRYVSCVQMHTDLHGYFGEAKPPLAADELPQSPILGSLGDVRPGTDTWSPVAE